jgi:putative membrane protein
MIFNVPIEVAFFWAVFIYTGYCITTSFLYWLNKDKPNHIQKNFSLLPLLILLDGFFVVAIDLFMDPLEVKAGAWRWLDGGTYYGIPIGNFVGWFLVTITVTGIYRLFEYFYSDRNSKIDRKVFLIPVIGYGTMSLSFGVSAFEYQLVSLAIIGMILMLPTVITNLFMFNSWNNNRF